MIVFQNSGLIDLVAVTTMGVSVKDGEGAIGYFGTGLKFAIATILRNGGSIEIWRGLDCYAFAVDPIEVRGAPLERVTMNGDPLGFTTMLGRNWESWMAFRELASNCRDEAGEYVMVPGAAGAREIALPDCTTIAVKGLDGIWPERDTILLSGAPIYSNAVMEIRRGASPYIYYRGVRIYTAPRPSVFTYNILEDMEITEDRTAKNWHSLEMQLERGIGAIEDRRILRDVLTCGENYQEHHMDVPTYGAPLTPFRELARELTFGTEALVNLNPAAARDARKSALADMKEGEGVTLKPIEEKMLDRALGMLESDGHAIRSFPILICDTLGAGIHGMAKDGRIYVSMSAFEKGTRELAATLLEEYAHLKSGCGDCTRGFQNWLFDQLLIRAEQGRGEPF